MKTEELTPVSDILAEALENAGFYRRAATRWLQVFFECQDDSERAWISRRRLHCLEMKQVPAVKIDDSFRDVYQAAVTLHRQMGLDLPEKNFRCYTIRTRRR